MAWVIEGILRAIGQAAPPDCVTEARIVELTGVGVRSIDAATRKMVKRGWLTKTARGCWKLTAAGRAAFETGAKVRSGPQGPHISRKIVRDSVRVRVWRALRIRTKASVPDLVQIVASGGERDIENNIQRYLRLLRRAGYVKLLASRQERRSLRTAFTATG